MSRMCSALQLMLVLLTSQVNSYPTVRGFTAIGTGGEDFVQAMVVAVESVLQQPIPEGAIGWALWTDRLIKVSEGSALSEEVAYKFVKQPLRSRPYVLQQGCVKQKLSSRGKYVSVNIGPVQVVSSEQVLSLSLFHLHIKDVQAVYNAMRRDDRMKYFL
ncbi:hypothetical protein HHK36_015834 [Tetracentron sinense]|uniref:Uncharacterized protein n=1 Tax=Tetracentron sinense TaxID=13715 RepID=A0A835DGK9_TETSI|nr:hypothetical protein HHK36_015834 [Tetracentron sinense]